MGGTGLLQESEAIDPVDSVDSCKQGIGIGIEPAASFPQVDGCAVRI